MSSTTKTARERCIHLSAGLPLHALSNNKLCHPSLKSLHQWRMVNTSTHIYHTHFTMNVSRRLPFPRQCELWNLCTHWTVTPCFLVSFCAVFYRFTVQIASVLPKLKYFISRLFSSFYTSVLVCQNKTGTTFWPTLIFANKGWTNFFGEKCLSQTTPYKQQTMLCTLFVHSLSSMKNRLHNMTNYLLRTICDSPCFVISLVCCPYSQIVCRVLESYSYYSRPLKPNFTQLAWKTNNTLLLRFSCFHSVSVLPLCAVRNVSVLVACHHIRITFSSNCGKMYCACIPYVTNSKNEILS